MTHSALRIFMAMYLAIWSPAMCCCGVKDAIGRMAGVATVPCHARVDAAVLEANTIDHSPRSCCAASVIATPCESAVVKTVGAASESDESDECRCHESLASKVRLDTGAKVIAPALLKSDVTPFSLATLPPSAHAIAPLQICVWPPGSDAHHAPPPRQSLLAHHCLLLV